MSLYTIELLRGDRVAVDLAYVGHDFVTRSDESSTIARFRPAASSEYGYDGQFSLFIAADPTAAPGYLDMASYRLQRSAIRWPHGRSRSGKPTLFRTRSSRSISSQSR
jgi:hypothetical protein